MTLNASQNHDALFREQFLGAKRVLVVESEPFTPHLETGMEIALRLNGMGIEVHYAAFQYPIGTFGRPRRPVTFGGKSMAQLLGERTTFHEHSISVDELERTASSLPNSVSGIGEFCIDGINLGLGALSSTVHRLRKIHLESAEEVVTARRFLAVAVDSFEQTQRLVTTLRVDSVVVFNGRFASAFGARMAARSNGVDFVSHERGSADDSFQLWRNTTPHDMSAWRTKFLEFQSRSDSDRADNASVSAIMRKRGFWPTEEEAGSQASVLPRSVAYFTSSFTEYAHTEWEYFSAWGNEQNAVSVLANACEQLGRTLYLRMHPNMNTYGADEVRLWEDVIQRHKSIVPIYPADAVNSYRLVEGAGLVATGFSTIGLEAAVMGRPVAVFADAPYVPAAGELRVRSDEEVWTAVENPGIMTPDVVGAARYSEFLLNYGIPYVAYSPTGSHNGLFLGHGRDKTPGQRMGNWRKAWRFITKHRQFC